MAVAAINYWSIPLAALAAFLWGAVYYTTLSKQWLAAVGLTEARSSRVPFAISLVALVVMAFVLSGAIAHLGPGQVTVKNGIISGLILWAGFVVTTIFVNNAYPGRRYMVSIIDSIHWLGVLVIQGAIIGAM
ncbi:MAG: DUF1761 domain-containing protein [Proteobacteria bacterium]|nr:DUF1761 domain-containing protein [Pseudomonadota bacterium]